MGTSERELHVSPERVGQVAGGVAAIRNYDTFNYQASEWRAARDLQTAIAPAPALASTPATIGRATF